MDRYVYLHTVVSVRYIGLLNSTQHVGNNNLYSKASIYSAATMCSPGIFLGSIKIIINISESLDLLVNIDFA
jgi:hypothetical protein